MTVIEKNSTNHLVSPLMEIKYIDRQTGKIEIEQIYGRWALALLYGESRFAQLFSFFVLPIISRVSWMSRWYGFLQTRPASARKVAPFIAAYGIDASEFASSSFASFNDFFIRKLKKERRPIAQGEDVAALPADGRYLVFPDLQQTSGFYVKGQQFDLPSFLQDSAMARRFEDGAMLIARLCPTDYHRFHFPCKGVPCSAREINGPLFSVNPIALRKKLGILAENKRMITEIETERFGTILYVEVGATFVGSIHQTYTPNIQVEKGEEKGYFSFGGSCLVLLFEARRIVFDADLIANSENGFETRALFGGSFGRALL